MPETSLVSVIMQGGALAIMGYFFLFVLPKMSERVNKTFEMLNDTILKIIERNNETAMRIRDADSDRARLDREACERHVDKLSDSVRSAIETQTVMLTRRLDTLRHEIAGNITVKSDKVDIVTSDSGTKLKGAQ